MEHSAKLFYETVMHFTLNLFCKLYPVLTYVIADVGFGCIVHALESQLHTNESSTEAAPKFVVVLIRHDEILVFGVALTRNRRSQKVGTGFGRSHFPCAP